MVEIIESPVEHEKTIFIDNNGTLTTSDYDSYWAEIMYALGLSKAQNRKIFENNIVEPEVEDLRSYIRTANQAIQGERFFTDIVGEEIYSKKIEEMNESIQLLKGAGDFVSDLKGKGYATAVLSSSPVDLAEETAEKAGADYVVRYKDIIFQENGEFDRLYLHPEVKIGKEDIIELQKQASDQVAIVGNGANDRGAKMKADAGYINRCLEENPRRSYEEALETVI